MKKLLCILSLLLACLPLAQAQGGAHKSGGNAATAPGHVVQHAGPRHARPAMVRAPRRHVIVAPHRRHPPARAMVRCRDGSLRVARPGACRHHGGLR